MIHLFDDFFKYKDDNTAKLVYISRDNGRESKACVGAVAGSATRSTISNCSVSADINVSATDDSRVGAIVGDIGLASLLSDCCSSGNINLSVRSLSKNDVRNAYAGGIVGYGSADNSYNTGDISSSFAAGGIAGKGKAHKCYNTGKVIAENTSNDVHAGGIVGQFTIYDHASNCYNTGDVKAIGNADNANAGGIAGTQSEEYTGVYHCYNVGNVSSVNNKGNANTGGIAGLSMLNSISNCYFLDSIASGIGLNGSKNDPTVKLTDAQMKDSASFADFDFEKVWTMGTLADYKYPVLRDVEMVLPGVLELIEVTSLPTKTKYTKNKDTLELTGAKLTLIYTDGTSEVINITNDMVTGFDNSIAGKQNLTVAYKDKSATFEIEVILTMPFTDVPKNAWYYNDILMAYDTGLVNGKNETTYEPDKELLYSEAVKLASCINQKKYSGAVTLTSGNPWYKSYVDYAFANGIIKSNYNWDQKATRAGYLEIFANALKDADLKEINEVPDGSIPDVPMTHPNAAAIYKLYRAGILQGSDAAHSCRPDANISRSEMAAIVSRMMDTSKRVKFDM